MEEEAQLERRKYRRKRNLCIALLLLVLVLVVIGIILAVVLQNDGNFERVLTKRCEGLKAGYDCTEVLEVFKSAYVGKDYCSVPPESYQALMDLTPIKPHCDRMMFWSKTKDAVHDFTSKRKCYSTLEDTFLGSLLNGLTWCSKPGKNETFTSDCPSWTQCVNNPVRSFWNKASQTFAEAACGNTSVMLSGSIPAPFSPDSIFGSVEVKHFNPVKVHKLEVILVSKDKVSTCEAESLKTLQKELKSGISYGCTEVSESDLEKCASDSHEVCGPCW